VISNCRDHLNVRDNSIFIPQCRSALTGQLYVVYFNIERGNAKENAVREKAYGTLFFAEENRMCGRLVS